MLRQHRSNQHGEDQRAEQGESDGPGHGLEQAAFDALQREDGQVRGDDDADGVEDGALYFVRGVADGRHYGESDFARGDSGGGRCFPP